MKTLFLILLTSTVTILAWDPIEEEIMNSNLEALVQVLEKVSPLSDIKKIRYLDLAQRIIEKRETAIILEKIQYPECHSPLLFLGAMGVFAIPIISLIYFSVEEGYDYHRDGLKPILISILSFSTALACACRGCIDECNYQKSVKDINDNALRVKQILYEA